MKKQIFTAVLGLVTLAATANMPNGDKDVKEPKVKEIKEPKPCPERTYNSERNRGETHFDSVQHAREACTIR